MLKELLEPHQESEERKRTVGRVTRHRVQVCWQSDPLAARAKLARQDYRSSRYSGRNTLTHEIGEIDRYVLVPVLQILFKLRIPLYIQKG